MEYYSNTETSGDIILLTKPCLDMFLIDFTPKNLDNFINYL